VPLLSPIKTSLWLTADSSFTAKSAGPACYKTEIADMLIQTGNKFITQIIIETPMTNREEEDRRFTFVKIKTFGNHLCIYATLDADV
jgi:hypothetical protein